MEHERGRSRVLEKLDFHTIKLQTASNGILQYTIAETMVQRQVSYKKIRIRMAQSTIERDDRRFRRMALLNRTASGVDIGTLAVTTYGWLLGHYMLF